jgi:phosphate transport system ATP-binding protein
VVKIQVKDLAVRYAGKEALKGISLEVPANEIIAIIGPAGSGKTTFLRAIEIDGVDVRSIRDVSNLRRRIGMVAPLPVGLPMSIYDNVAFAPRMGGTTDKAELDHIVERCLMQAALWDEVKERLPDLGTKLSGGQQQRLTIARALSHSPEILCLDEFSIAVDPVTTMRIEDVLKQLQQHMTIVLVTNLVQQARRLAHNTAFFLQGELVEVGPTHEVFGRSPKDQRTFQYTQGQFG